MIFLSSLINRNSWGKQGYFPVHKQQALTKRVTVKPCIFSKLTILLVSYSLKDLWGAVWVGQLECTVPAITPPAPIRSCSQPTPKRRVITDLCSLTLPRSPQSATWVLMTVTTTTLPVHDDPDEHLRSLNVRWYTVCTFDTITNKM